MDDDANAARRSTAVDDSDPGDLPIDLEESLAVLVSIAKGRFGRISPDRIARHVLCVTEGADWPVRRAAMEALRRRYSFGERDRIRIVRRPKGDHVLGTYVVARGGSGARKTHRDPRYETALLSIEPLRTSCGCADFVRASLGLCKHTLVVLEALERSRALTRPARADARKRPRLLWSVSHPLAGSADRLARLEVEGGAGGVAIEGFKRGRPEPLVLRDSVRRLGLISRIGRLVASGKLDVEPAVATLLAEEGERAERFRHGRDGAKSAERSLSSLRRRLYPYQREGVVRFFKRGRLLLADDMGLGKTTQAIAACHGLFKSGQVRRGLLIVPAALKSQWKREWEATSPVPLALVDGAPAERAALYRETASGFLVIGYEQLLRDFEAVQRFAPQIVVLDEAQRIKNWATKSASYVKALQPRFRLVLTGTPMENRFDELASIVDFVDDVALEPKWRLVPWHSIAFGNGSAGFGGARNLDILRQRLTDVMLRRVRGDVLRQLPTRTDTRVPVSMTEAQQIEHDELRMPIAQIMARAARRPLTQPEFLRLMQLLTTQRIICNGLAQLRFEEEWPRCLGVVRPTRALLESMCTPKLSALRDVTEHVVLNQNRKAIVFSQWRNMLRLAEWAVRDLVVDAGGQVRFFTGAESPRMRERAIVDFHDDPSVKMLFLTDAGGVGLNLQHAASCCINLELPWNPAVLEQRIGRIYRLGQTLPIDVYNLVSEVGIEARIAQVVAGKKAVFTSLFDGTTDEVRFDTASSFLEGVKRLVDAPELPDSATEEPLDAVESEEAHAPARDVEEGSAFALAESPMAPEGSPTSVVDTISALARISFTTLPDGGLRIDAPPGAAAPLAALFEGLARSLRGTLGDGA